GFRPRVTQEVTDPYMMLTFVATGMGVTIAAEDLASIMPRGARWVRLSDAPSYMHHGIAWVPSEQTAAVSAVLELSQRILPTPLIPAGT
ncbi:LysR substrate-binding domain-containing protein, partial [Acinetobacter baumannii]